MASYCCGFCGSKTADNQTMDVGAYLHPRSSETLTTWRVSICADCGRPTMIAMDTEIPYDTPSINLPPIRAPRLFYPPQGWAKVSNIDKVPESIKADYEEAIECLVGGQNKAAAATARRAVQGVCINLGANSKERLVDQIYNLKDEHKLTERLAKLAHDVRSFGNDGAHPGKDGLDKVSLEDAEDAVRFLGHLLEHVYIIGED